MNRAGDAGRIPLPHGVNANDKAGGKMRALWRRTILALLAGVMAMLSGMAAQAGDIAPKVPIDKSKGSCVLPGDQMRREHMKILMHRRDNTLYKGIRGGKASFSACLTCHMVKDAQGKPVTIKSPKHFCRVCHDFAAVRPDCWSCHKSVPEAGDAGNQAMLKGFGSGQVKGRMFAQLRDFVQEGRK